MEVVLFNNDGMSVDSCKNLLDIVSETSPMNIKRIEFYNNMSGDAGAKHISELLTLPEFTPADVTRLAPYLDFTCPTPEKRHGRR